MNKIRKTTAVKPGRLGGGLVVVGLAAVVLGGLAAGPRESERDSLDARRQRIEHMDAEGKAQLLKRQSQFNALTDDEKRLLTDLHQEITDDQQAEQLHQVMHGYYDWLKTLTPSQRSEIRDVDLKPTERVERIKQMREAQDRRRLDAEGFRRWLDTTASRLNEQRPDSAPEDVRRRVGNISDSDRRNRIRLLVDLVRGQLKSEDLADLRESLSAETGQRLEGMKEAEKWREIRRMVGSLSRPPVTDEELAEFLQSDELSEQHRDMLLNLPVQDMRRWLTLRYLGARPMEGLFGFPGGRPGRSGRGGPAGSGRPPGGDPPYPGSLPPDRSQRGHPGPPPRPSGGRLGGPAQ